MSGMNWVAVVLVLSYVVWYLDSRIFQACSTGCDGQGQTRQTDDVPRWVKEAIMGTFSWQVFLEGWQGVFQFCHFRSES